MVGFTAALTTGPNALNASMLNRLNVTSSFNYREFVLTHTCNNTHACTEHPYGQQQQRHQHTADCDHHSRHHSSHPTTKASTIASVTPAPSPPPLHAPNPVVSILRKLFVDFQLNSTEKYVQSIRSYINNGKPGTPLSCNNGGRWGSPYNLCDYGMGELSKTAANPGGLESIFRDMVPAGRVQVMTMPKSKNISAADTPLIRWSIATAYALGGNMLVPWVGGARFSTKIFTRGCYWFPRLLA
jgi:hypothetical protein